MGSADDFNIGFLEIGVWNMMHVHALYSESEENIHDVRVEVKPQPTAAHV